MDGNQMVKVLVYNVETMHDEWLIMTYNSFLTWRFGHSYFEVVPM